MPKQSQLNFPSLEELRSFYAPQVSSFDPTKFTKAYEVGMTLQDTIAQKALERQKAEAELKKEIEAAKALAQKKETEAAFVAAAQKPLVQPTPFRDVTVPKEEFTMSLERPQVPLAELVGKKATELDMAQDINQLQAQRRQTEQQRVDELNRPIELLNRAIAEQPDVYAKSLLSTPKASTLGVGIREINVPNPDGSSTARLVGVDAKGMYNPLNPSQRFNTIEEAVNAPERAYASQFVQTASGDWITAPKSRSGQTVSTATAPIPEKRIGTVMNVDSLSVKDRDAALSMITDARNDENIKKARNLIGQMRSLREQIVSDNPIAIDRLGGQIQKLVAGDTGNLAAWEQRDPNSRAYVQRFLQFLSMGAEGILLPKNKEKLLELLDIVDKNMKINIDENADFYATSMVETFPQLNKAAMKRKIGIGTYTIPGKPEDTTSTGNAGTWDQSKENRYQELLRKKQQGTLK